VLVDETADALVADAEVEPHIGTDRDPVDAVVVIDAAKSAEQLAGRPIRLAVAVLVLEEKDIRRLADIYPVSRADRVLGNRDSHGRQDFLRLIEGNSLVRMPRSGRVFEDDNAVALRAEGRAMVKRVAIVDRLAHPDPSAMIDIHARRVDEERFGRPEFDL